MFPSVFTVNCCLLFTCLRWGGCADKKGLATKTNPSFCFFFSAYLVPKIRSPASPRPGRM